MSRDVIDGHVVSFAGIGGFGYVITNRHSRVRNNEKFICKGHTVQLTRKSDYDELSKHR